MAVTLSTANYISVFQCMGMTYANEFHGVDGMGTLVSNEYITSAMSQAKPALINYITNVMDDAMRTLLISYANEYDATGFNVGQIQGNVGDVTGVTFSWKEKRDFIAEKIRSILPYDHIQGILKKQSNQPDGSAFVGICR